MTYRVRHDSRVAEFLREAASLSCCFIAMFPLHMTPYGIVTGEGSRTVGTRNTDTLMPLSDVSSEIGFVTIGALAKRTFEFSA